MSISTRIVKAAGRILGGIRAGTDQLAIRHLERVRSIPVWAEGFASGGPIPDRYAGADAQPPVLMWSEAPAETAEFVILCEDPDAPLPRPFVHWVVYGIPAGTARYPHDSVSATGPWALVPVKEGKNSKRKLGFTGAAPPPGHGVHHYHFQLFALDTPLSLGPGAERDAVVNAMNGHVLASGETVGTYEAK